MLIPASLVALTLGFGQPVHRAALPAPRSFRTTTVSCSASASPSPEASSVVLSRFWSTFCTAAGKEEVSLSAATTGDAPLLAEYINTCGELCANEGCEVVAETDPPDSVRVRMRVGEKVLGGLKTVEADSAGRGLDEAKQKNAALESLMDWFTARLVSMVTRAPPPGRMRPYACRLPLLVPATHPSPRHVAGRTGRQRRRRGVRRARPRAPPHADLAHLLRRLSPGDAPRSLDPRRRGAFLGRRLGRWSTFRLAYLH